MTRRMLPVTKEECIRRGWDAPDFVYVVGEAYVDHPSFGHAIISRVLEKAGYKVAMLCLPDWHTCEDFKRFGQPKIGFLVTAGVIDSMVNHYTAARRRRNQDAYAPGGKAGMRPDRALTVYCNRIHEAYPKLPILIGGVEASLRRFSHYDYWDDKVRRSVLVDTSATLLMYGMGEKSILECVRWVEDGMPQERLPEMRGVCYLAKTPPKGVEMLPSHADIAADKKMYAKAFLQEYNHQDPVRGRALCQMQDANRYLVQNPPVMPLSAEELDEVYALPYTRQYHPSYEAEGGVPALSEVKFSISAVRGCFGACNFCALTFHQGRIVQSRSEESLLKEAEELMKYPDFKGYIHDVGGPTANFRAPACKKQMTKGCCEKRQCLFPTPCPNMDVSHKEFLQTLRKMRRIPGIKKVFIRSGLRFDYIMADKNADEVLQELCRHHISGQLKVAPEHISDDVLKVMGKPCHQVYEGFGEKYRRMNEKLGMKQYLVPYLMSSHPGSTMEDAVKLALYLKEHHVQPEQVQDFYPTPGTLSTCMYYTGIDPRTMKEVYVPRTQKEKDMQRALLQWKKPENHALIRQALRQCGREDLIGFSQKCLVPPAKEREMQRGYAKRSGDRRSDNERKAPNRKMRKF
ncbi:MAG: YgiQ family radical SAM protein [Clostridia bacterium]|nr:YgiQ family radical SAM protein [Clostridia bacterium]